MNDLERQEKMLDLLTEKAISGLDEQSQQELKELLNNYPEWHDGEETLALTAAAIKLSAFTPDEEIPVHLSAKILAQSERYFSTSENEGKVVEFRPRTEKQTESVAPAPVVADSKAGISVWNWAGWAIAAAACIALAINLWLPRTTESPVLTNNQAPSTPTAPPLPGLSEQRQQFLASAPDLVQENWAEANPKEPRNIEGDIVWSNALQKGFVRFRNLPVNDKTRETYQLWIFDANQNEKTPIDGGVFDVDANGDVIVPINAKLKVQKPTMFAVTKEKPGGVVVSDPKRVVTIAKIET